MQLSSFQLQKNIVILKPSFVRRVGLVASKASTGFSTPRSTSNTATNRQSTRCVKVRGCVQYAHITTSNTATTHQCPPPTALLHTPSHHRPHLSPDGVGANEQWLWHGTDLATIQSIGRGGFNRSYNTTAVYGDGVYFARDASYSANARYAQPDAQGNVSQSATHTAPSICA